MPKGVYPRSETYRAERSVATRLQWKMNPIVGGGSKSGAKHSADCGHCSVATRAKMSAAKIAHIGKEDCKCAACVPQRTMTRPHRALVEVLLAEFPEVHSEVLFGHFRVDAYLPSPYHLAFEADGEFWHRNRKKVDEARDAWLLRKFDLPVIRLSENELKWSV